MRPRTKDRMKVGAMAAGTFALGASGAAGAGALIDGKDIQNKSIGFADLSNKAVKKLRNRAPRDFFLVGSGTADGGTTVFTGVGAHTTFPGTFDSSISQGAAESIVPALPASGYRVRGLAVQAADGKGTAVAPATFTLAVDGTDTGLTCTTSAGQGRCTANANIQIAPGSALSIKAVNNTKSYLSFTATVGFRAS